MKRLSISIALLVVTLCATALSFGQTQSGATAEIKSIPFEILDQPDCPLKISIDERLAARIPAATLKITNTDPSTVNAFVLIVNSDLRNDHSDLVFLLAKGIAFEESYTKIVGIRSMADSPKTPVISVDYIQFADGKTWGADSLGRSADAKSYIKGHDLALSRLKELLAGQDGTDVLKAINSFRSSSFGESVSRPDRGLARTDFFVKGYGEIINILRHMQKKADEGKELANKLEAMGSSRP